MTRRPSEIDVFVFGVMPAILLLVLLIAAIVIPFQIFRYGVGADSFAQLLLLICVGNLGWGFICVPWLKALVKVGGWYYD